MKSNFEKNMILLSQIEIKKGQVPFQPLTSF